jgi:hypothetical protein
MLLKNLPPVLAALNNRVKKIDFWRDCPGKMIDLLSGLE